MKKVVTSLIACLLVVLAPSSGMAMAPPPPTALAYSAQLDLAFSSAFAAAQPPAQVPDVITIERSIVIHRSPQAVFDFAADFLNDPHWREEVNTMTSNDPLGLGAVYLEDSHLGLQPSFLTETEIVAFNPPSLVTAVTTDNNPYYLTTSRSFQRWGWFSTRITYTLEFERALVEATIGAPLPDAVIELYYNTRMTEYLFRLKFLLETGIASTL